MHPYMGERLLRRNAETCSLRQGMHSVRGSWVLSNGRTPISARNVVLRCLDSCTVTGRDQDVAPKDPSRVSCYHSDYT
jgi:hypothetical protein